MRNTMKDKTLNKKDVKIEGVAKLQERKEFKAPRIKRHEQLPVITAGSVNLW